VADTRIDELRRRLERDPGSRLFAQLAEELRKGGELGEAIRVARAGLAVNPAYPSARLTLGRALLDSGDATGARAELESALRDAPDNIQASRHLAQAREQLGDLKGAADQYRKTLLMAPDDRQLQGALASVEARLQAPAGDSALAAESTPPATRRAPPPLPARPPTSADSRATPGQGTASAAPPAPRRAPRAGAPPLVFAPSAGGAGS
jgi:predicted Zn-dependent protease